MISLSIIVPTYNVEDYLERCLSSLITNRRDFEVLVIIDGSEDRSAEIAKKYQSEYPELFQVIEKENGHYGSCVNVGLALAKGKYIKILDSDDYFISDNFPSYLDFAAEFDADLLLSDSSMIKNGEHGSFYSFDIPGNQLLSLDFLKNKNLYDLPHQSIAYKRELLQQINYVQTEGVPFTDLEWVSYPMIAVKSIAYFKGVLYEYDLSREGQSVSQKAHCKAMDKDCLIVEKMASYYEIHKDCIPLDNRRVLREIVFNNLVRIYFHFLINWPKLLNNKILVEYDNEIHRISPELYMEASKAVERRKFMSFKYIDEWRRRKSRNTLVYFFFDTGVALGRLVNRSL
ncbi:MAG: glycosyltransferase [Bacteroidales bacterium]|nr:glycosyltransferase [Bacteroidales bacterium]